MSGIVKGIGHAVKSVVKGVVGFVKKYWVAIVVAAAIVFTAGIASVGVGAWTSAMSAGASSGFGGFMGAVGSTFSAGASALTGGLIGSTTGLTSLAGSTGAAAGGAATGFAGGPSFSATEGITAGTNAGAAAGSGFAADSATGALAGGAGGAGSAGFNVFTGAGTFTGPGAIAAAPTAITAPSAAASSLASGASGAANAAGAGASGAANAAGSGAAGAAGSGAAGAAPAAGHSFLGGLLNSRAGGALILTAGDMLQGSAQGKIAEQQFNETKPLGTWGVGLRGNATDAPVNNLFQPGEGLTSAASTNPFTPLPAQGNQQPLQQISPYVPDARAPLPNGQQWMPNLPNANQGLMTIGWNTQTGQPVYSNTPATQSPGY